MFLVWLADGKSEIGPVGNSVVDDVLGRIRNFVTCGRTIGRAITGWRRIFLTL